MSFSTLPPGASVDIKSYEISTPQEKLDELKTLIKLGRIAPPTYESLSADTKNNKFGISHEWIVDAKQEWMKFDWKKTEDHLNTFPNFITTIQHKGTDYKIHFVALFSAKKDAVPLAYFHGWPGSFLEFIPTLSLLKKKYSPETLPYNVVVPSLPGYALSSGPSLEQDTTTADIAPIMNELMVKLGFGDAYIAQGGDLGTAVSRYLYNEFPGCKAAHVNMLPAQKPENAPEIPSLPEHEQVGLQRAKEFYETGSSYARSHATRPATTGFVLQSSPIALLAWIGEKFISWSDETPPLQAILESVTLYWITDTIARCIYPYRSLSFGEDKPSNKPFGLSSFAKEIVPTPESWVELKVNLVFYRYHAQGGHFAALERPEVLLNDVEEFIEQVW